MLFTHLNAPRLRLTFYVNRHKNWETLRAQCGTTEMSYSNGRLQTDGKLARRHSGGNKVFPFRNLGVICIRRDCDETARGGSLFVLRRARNVVRADGRQIAAVPRSNGSARGRDATVSITRLIRATFTRVLERERKFNAR